MKQQLGIAPAVVIASIGPIITKARTIISKVAPLLQNVFSSRATKELRAQKGEYDQANTQIRVEISQLNSAINELQAHGNAISQQMRQLGVNGLAGIDGYQDLGNIFRKIIDRITGKTKATNQLNSAKAEYERLSTERDQKLTAANEMVQQLDSLQKRLEEAIRSNSSLIPGVSNMLLLGMAAAAVTAGVVAYKSSKPSPLKKKK